MRINIQVGGYTKRLTTKVNRASFQCTKHAGGQFKRGKVRHFLAKGNSEEARYKRNKDYYVKNSEWLGTNKTLCLVYTGSLSRFVVRFL